MMGTFHTDSAKSCILPGGKQVDYELPLGLARSWQAVKTNGIFVAPHLWPDALKQSGAEPFY